MSRWEFDQQTQIPGNGSMDFSVNQSLMQQIMNGEVPEEDPQQQIEEKLEWIKKKSHAKKHKRGEQAQGEKEEKKDEEKPGCAVYVRLRPDNEQEGEYPQMVAVKDRQSVEVTTEQRTNLFSFDRVFNEGVDQEEVFKAVALPLVKDFINGFNESILVYGQSGSGKTHTILGPGFDNLSNIQRMKQQLNQQPDHMHPTYGLVPRMVQAVFQQIADEVHSDKTYDVRLSYIEIYNEKIRDLLDNNDEVKAKIYHDKNSNLVVCNATQIPIEDSGRMLDLVQKGSQQRHIGETDLNAHSSRSHAIIVLTCVTTTGTSQEQTASQMLLIDLAGTENIERSGAQGIRVKEACNINTSLLALGNVIDDIINLGRYKEQLKGAVCEKQQKTIMEKIKNCHIGYRDSLLTRLLENCLGGNSYTRLICCASKNQLNLSETVSTLRFASRASQIKNKPKVNKKLSAEQLHRLLEHTKQQCKQLTLVTERQSDQLEDYAQLVRRMLTLIPPRLQQGIKKQLGQKVGFDNGKASTRVSISALGKHSLLRVFSFLELPQITLLVGLNTQVHGWMTRAEGFWRKQLALQVRLKNLSVTNPEDIPDARMHINLLFNNILLQRQRSKVKSTTAGLSLFKGTGRQ